MDAGEKAGLVATRSDWFHSFDFGDGVLAAGSCPPDYLEMMWRTFGLPEDMKGLRVLDVGTYDGWFAFEAERRGAKVVAIDINPIDTRCFDVARRILRSQVEYHEMGVYDMSAQALGGEFDIVLFLGVYYHLRHLFHALDSLWSITRGFAIVETHVIDHQFVLDDGTITTLADFDPRLVSVPIYRFYRANDLGDDWSNWFGGNIAAVEGSLASAGFRPKLLGTWGGRAVWRAEKDPTVPREWEIGSYEGTTFHHYPDGSWRSNWINPRTHSRAPRAPEPVTPPSTDA